MQLFRRSFVNKLQIFLLAVTSVSDDVQQTGRSSGRFETRQRHVLVLHQTAQGASWTKDLWTTTSQSVGVNGVTAAPNLRKPTAAGCLTRFKFNKKISYFVFRLPSYIQGSNSIKYLAWISCIFLPQLEQRLALPHLPSNSHPLHSQLHTGYVTIPLQLGGVNILKQNWLPWTCSGAWIRKELKLFIFYKMTMVGIWLGSPVSFASLPPLARLALSRLLRPHVARLK